MADTDAAQYPHIYRAITSKRFFDATTQKANAGAFLLRTTRGETGLSMLKDVRACTKDICEAGMTTCFGELVLDTDHTRALGLQVLDDDRENESYSPNHAEIIGIPPDQTRPEDKKRAEDLAEQLAAIARLHYDRDNKFK